MDLFSDTWPGEARYCGFCLQPWPATDQYYARHKYGRGGWATICRWCANEDRALRYRLARAHPKREGQLCECGALATQLDHSHEPPFHFIKWCCRSCNLKGRRPCIVGWRGPRS